MQLQFEISDKSYELLLKIHNAGLAEFRDSEYSNLYEFLKKEGKDWLDAKDRFERRNFCNLQDLDELLLNNLIDDGPGMDWHLTYYVSDFGKKILKNKNLL